MVERGVCVVTGAAGLVGRALVDGFTADGYRVVAVDRVPMPPTIYHLPPAHTIVVDLKQAEAIEAMMDEVVAEVGPPNVLINNAAMAHFHKPLQAVSVDEIDALLAVNLRGTILCCRAFIRCHDGTSYGRIINIASTRWHQNEAHWELYGASKGGVVSLTQSLCVSLADTPITVNALSPGWIASPDEHFTAEEHRQHPSRRIGRPDDIYRAAAFFAAEANDFVNGAHLIVDGGMTKRMIYR